MLDEPHIHGGRGQLSAEIEELSTERAEIHGGRCRSPLAAFFAWRRRSRLGSEGLIVCGHGYAAGLQMVFLTRERLGLVACRFSGRKSAAQGSPMICAMAPSTLRERACPLMMRDTVGVDVPVWAATRPSVQPRCRSAPLRKLVLRTSCNFVSAMAG